VRERFNVPGCRFEVQKTAPGASFVGDGDAIVTALVNLLDNAWKYSGDEKSIALGAATEKGNVIFSVRDNGEGIPSRDLKKIFKRFYQVDQRLSRNGGGCGLGLSIVQFIMRAHKGTVEVESRPGGGSMFRLILPAAQINRDRDDSDEATAVSNVSGSSMERSGSQAEEAVRK